MHLFVWKCPSGGVRGGSQKNSVKQTDPVTSANTRDGAGLKFGVCVSQLFPGCVLKGLQKVTFRCCSVKHRCVFCILTWSWFSCWGDKRAATAESPDRDVWSSVNTELSSLLKRSTLTRILTRLSLYLVFGLFFVGHVLFKLKVVFCSSPSPQSYFKKIRKSFKLHPVFYRLFKIWRVVDVLLY